MERIIRILATLMQDLQDRRETWHDFDQTYIS